MLDLDGVPQVRDQLPGLTHLHSGPATGFPFVGLRQRVRKSESCPGGVPAMMKIAGHQLTHAWRIPVPGFHQEGGV